MYLGCSTQCADRNPEQTRVWFLNAVFERQRVTVYEMIESVVNEVAAQVVMDVADNANAHAECFQIAEHCRRVGIRHRCIHIAVALADGQRELVVEAGQTELEQYRRAV